MVINSRGYVPSKVKEAFIAILSIWDLAIIIFIILFLYLTRENILHFSFWWIFAFAAGYIIFISNKVNKYLMKKYHTNIKEAYNNPSKLEPTNAANGEIIEKVLKKSFKS